MVSQGSPRVLKELLRWKETLQEASLGLSLASDFLFTVGFFPSLHLLGNKNSLIMTGTPGRTQ